MGERSFLYELRPYLIYVKVGERSFLYELRPYLIYVKVGERSFLYELRPYLIYVKVGERSFLYELRPYLIYVKVGERRDFYFCLFLLSILGRVVICYFGLSSVLFSIWNCFSNQTTSLINFSLKFEA